MIEKDASAFRTIGELSAELNVKPHILRYWEEQFPMLEPLKRAGGRRYYRPADVELTRAIDRLLNQEGYTVRGARKVLEQVQNGGKDAAAGTLDMFAGDEDRMLGDLRRLRLRLADMKTLLDGSQA